MSELTSVHVARINQVERIVVLAAIAAALALLIWAARMLGAGLDFSDDGYYLAFDRAPSLSHYTVSQFGFIYNPLFYFLGWDVALFRQTNMAVTALLSGTLVALSLRLVDVPRARAALIGVIFAPVSLILYYTWIPSPGYNSLTFQALLLVAIALVAIGAGGRAAFAGWIILGVGGWLAFMAKPTSAALLAPVILIYLVAARQARPLGIGLAIAVAAGLLLASALIIDGSIAAFVNRLSMGSELAATMGGGHTFAGILRFDYFTLSIDERIALVANTALIAIATYGIEARSLGLRSLALAIVAAYVLTTFGVALGWIVPSFGLEKFIALQIWAAPFGAVIGVALPGGRGLRPSAKTLLLASLFAVFPHVMSFGTNTNYWANGAMAGLFWVVAGVVLVVRPGVSNWRRPFPCAVGAIAIVALIMAGITQHPYRQTQPLSLQNTATRVGPNARPMPLSKDFSAYIQDLQELSDRAGFVAGTPVVDLTGHYPGALFALDAQAIGQAWMIGGYAGSNEVGHIVLESTPCELVARAWVLTEPTGERALLQSAVMPAGLTFEDVGGVMSPTGTYPSSYEQRLLRPTGDMASRRDVCQAARE